MISIPLRIQDLPASLAHYVLDVERFMKRYIASFHQYTLFVACSGGADSLSLLLTLYYLRKRLGYSLHILHCNHMLRQEAQEEEEYVAHIARLLGLPYTAHNIDVMQYAQQHRKGIEESGRICRYQFFYNIMQSYTRPLLCTGHHANDLAEDIIMRLLRGTSLDMLCAMPAFSSSRQLLRPLLYQSKEQLVTFLTELNIPWKEDATNQDSTYLRSRLRTQIMPFLMQENPSLLDSFRSLHTQTEWDIDYWETLLETSNPLKISYHILHSLHKAGRIRLYRKACVHLGIQLSFDTFIAIDDAVSAKKTKQFHLPQSYIAQTTSKDITFYKHSI